jgi:hypothetical protein
VKHVGLLDPEEENIMMLWNVNKRFTRRRGLMS